MSSVALASPYEHNTIRPTAADDIWRYRLDAELFTVARLAGLTDDYDVYKDNYAKFFRFLDDIDAQLNVRRYLGGGATASAADQWFAVALWLYSSVFYALYKLNRQRLEEFTNLGHFLRDIFDDRAFRGQVDFNSLKRSYCLESDLLNPKQRLPLDAPDLDAPHDRSLRFGISKRESDIEENQLTRRQQGEWKRKTSGHRQHISADGSSGFLAERGRYHLYIANNCPWCHRTALTRQLKGLEDIVTMDVLYFRRDPIKGWQFRPREPGCTPDTIYGYQFVRELYDRVGSSETSVPILWDRKTESIVSNESAEIIRMFNGAFRNFQQGTPELYPSTLQTQIDRVNVFTYHAVNNGAYKAGFADSQKAYESAYRTFFEALDTLDQMLRGRRFLFGDSITEADVRLFPTLFRFDAVYYTRFNLGLRMVRDIPSLKHWLEEMLAIPAISKVSSIDHCRKGYFGRTGNNIVPLGPRDRP